MTLREPDPRPSALVPRSRSRRAALRDLSCAGVAAAMGIGSRLQLGHTSAAETAIATPRATPSAAATAGKLIYLPATEALALFRAKELSPVDVLEAQIAQIE